MPVTRICAGNVDPAALTSACYGDSGGPFVILDASTNAYYIAGIVSYGVFSGSIQCGGKIINFFFLIICFKHFF